MELSLTIFNIENNVRLLLNTKKVLIALLIKFLNLSNLAASNQNID